jgi:hypothetical protein
VSPQVTFFEHGRFRLQIQAGLENALGISLLRFPYQKRCSNQ